MFEPLLSYCDNNRYFIRWLKAKLSKGTVPNKNPDSKVCLKKMEGMFNKITRYFRKYSNVVIFTAY